MDFAPPFQMAHPKAFELAERVAQMAPEGMGKVFFANSGSEAVDTALKMALAYHRVRGEGTRTRLIGRERGYHGVNFGGISVGGMVGNRKMFGTGRWPASTTSATRTTRRATPSASASRRTAPSSPTTWSAWWRCTTRATSPP
jgi:adenosylmethionine-8-amino-7-oxononanoate aminotransferase